MKKTILTIIVLTIVLYFCITISNRRNCNNREGTIYQTRAEQIRVDFVSGKITNDEMRKQSDENFSNLQRNLKNCADGTF